MSASVHGAGGRPGLRWVLVAVTLFDLLALLLIAFFQPAPDVRMPWTPEWLFSILDEGWPAALLLVVATIGLIGFARGRRAEPWFLLVLLLAMALLVEAVGAYLGSHHRRYYSLGAALLGWLLGLGLGRLRGADQARCERLAEAGAGAALVATYFNAGLQKLLGGALFEVHAMQTHVLSHHPIDDTSLLGSLTRLVALDSRVAEGFALLTVVIQVGAIVYLFGPRLRMLWGTLLIAFHLGTLALLSLMYVEATILFLAWSYPWGRIVARLRGKPRPAPIEVDDPPLERGELVLLAGVVLLAVGVASVLPTPHELAAPVEVHDPNPSTRGSHGHGDRDSSNRVEQLGPLRVGATLGGWVIESIEIGASEARVNVDRGEDRARFGFSGPRGNAPEGPYGVGDLHIYYSAPEAVDLDSLALAGEALREALRGEGDTPGGQVDAWIDQARASLPVR